MTDPDPLYRFEHPRRRLIELESLLFAIARCVGFGREVTTEIKSGREPCQSESPTAADYFKTLADVRYPKR